MVTYSGRSTATSESELSSRSHSSSGGSHKQASGFKKEWLKGRQHCLAYIDTLCIRYDKGPYNRLTWNKTPCTRFRLQSIVSHESSAAHCGCVRLELAAAATPTITEAIRLLEVPPKVMEQAFSCLYFLAKHTTNFGPLLDFLGSLGLNAKADMQVAKNATYTSVKSIQEMLSIYV